MPYASSLLANASRKSVRGAVVQTLSMIRLDDPGQLVTAMGDSANGRLSGR
jgi:hypothetical protein